MPKAFCILLLTALAAHAGETDDPRLQQLAKHQLGKDFRIVFTLEKNALICGGEGDAYIGQVEMNKPVPQAGSDNTVQMTDHWVKIDKVYSVMAAELDAPHPGLMDRDSCLE